MLNEYTMDIDEVSNKVIISYGGTCTELPVSDFVTAVAECMNDILYSLPGKDFKEGVSTPMFEHQSMTIREMEDGVCGSGAAMYDFAYRVFGKDNVEVIKEHYLTEYSEYTHDDTIENPEDITDDAVRTTNYYGISKVEPAPRVPPLWKYDLSDDFCLDDMTELTPDSRFALDIEGKKVITTLKNVKMADIITFCKNVSNVFMDVFDKRYLLPNRTDLLLTPAIVYIILHTLGDLKDIYDLTTELSHFICDMVLISASPEIDNSVDAEYIEDCIKRAVEIAVVKSVIPK